MRVPEGMSGVGHIGNLHMGRGGLFLHNNGHMISRNDVLIVSSLPID